MGGLRAWEVSGGEGGEGVGQAVSGAGGVGGAVEVLVVGEDEDGKTRDVGGGGGGAVEAA
ncbi:hypothetical protein AB0478_37400 [Streptomyces sp. NPDC051917]|uniref:hypothetical protein n=1 Tax=Streptomyces sp. NPDC051917 TaxID=3154754 RepID=UPI00345361AA